MEELILVNEKGENIGYNSKIEIHKEGQLHRAFSILIYNSNNEILIQKRAKNKYHSAGLWSNSCCSHPRIGEVVKDAAKRRLREELGISCILNNIGSFIYKVKFSNDLFEYEFDHVLIGEYNGDIVPNYSELEMYRWIEVDDLIRDIECNPNRYTYWFNIIMKKFKEDIYKYLR